MKARGFSLVEALLGLLVVMAAIVAVFMMAARANQSAVEQEARNAEAVIQAVIKGYGMPQGHYANAQSNIVAERLAPPEMMTTGVLRSRWGRVNIVPFNEGTRRNAGFYLSYQGVPHKHCLEFLRRLPRGERRLAVGTMVVGGGGTFDPQTAMRACDQGGNIVIEHYSGELGER